MLECAAVRHRAWASVLVSLLLTTAGCVSARRTELQRPAGPERAGAAMQDLLRVSPGADLPQQVNVIVEIPKGSLNKYEFNAKQRVIELDRVLGGTERYPVEYGFVPQTLMPDGDPLDFVMPVTEPTHPGVLVEARPIGVMRMLDQGAVDDKIVCVPVKDPRFQGIDTLEGLPLGQRDVLSRFFSSYKDPEGKSTSVPGFGDVEEAHRLIRAAHEAYVGADQESEAR